jgi:hypothetical protein
MQPTASLAALIYNFSGMPSKNQVELAWAAALVLVALVFITNLVGQNLSRQQNLQDVHWNGQHRYSGDGLTACRRRHHEWRDHTVMSRL